MRILYLGLMTNSVGFKTAMRKHATEFKMLRCGEDNFNNKAKGFVIDFRPDIVFIQIQTPNILEEETARILAANCKCVINWTGDVRHPIPQWYYDIGKQIDLTCFSNMTDVREFRTSGLKSEYLEIGYDPEIYKPEGEKIEAKDIVFLGNNYGDGFFPESTYRREMVEFLTKEYPNNFGVYGNGWANSIGDFNSSQPEEAKLLRGAKIAINLSHYNYERYNSDRILRIMGTGVMCLTRHYLGLETDFSPDNNLVIWDNFDELKTNIDYYLKNDEQRIEIANNGHKLMLESFTYDSMIKKIINLAK